MDKLIKLLPVIALAAFWWKSPGTVRRVMGAARNGPKAVMTTMDMSQAQKALAYEYLNNERFPADIGQFLRENIQGLPRPECDRWGTPYALVQVPEDPVLVSCGGDLACPTDDDLRLRILPRKKSGDDAAYATE